jgi:hypothetical protein
MGGAGGFMIRPLFLLAHFQKSFLSLSVAEGSKELKQASQWHPHRRSISIYESANPIGTKDSNDKNEFLLRKENLQRKSSQFLG